MRPRKKLGVEKLEFFKVDLQEPGLEIPANELKRIRMNQQNHNVNVLDLDEL